MQRPHDLRPSRALVCAGTPRPALPGPGSRGGRILGVFAASWLRPSSVWLTPLFTLLLISACSGTPRSGRRSFGPEELRVVANHLEIKALQADYGKTRLDLRLQVHNTGPATIEIDPQACLLGYQDLEYPPTRDASQRPRLVSLQPSTRRVLHLSFELGRTPVGSSQLVFRGLRSDHRWQTPLVLAIPGRIPNDAT